MTSTLHVDLIGVPLDLGGNRRGTDMGPSALRIARIRERLQELPETEVRDCGDIAVSSRETSDFGQASAHYESQIHDSCAELAARVEASLAAGSLPLVMGGDHSIAIGTIAGVAAHHRKVGTDVGVIWVDAHADMNTPGTSPSGNVHGMPLAVNLGLGSERMVQLGGFSPKVRPDRVALVGIRDLDRRERLAVEQSGVHTYTMKDVDRLGMNAVAEEAIARVTAGGARLHLSLDLDGINPDIAPGVGTPVPGGLTYREAHLLFELIADSGALCSAEVVELNPVLDDRNMTGRLAVDLIRSALGKQIL